MLLPLPLQPSLPSLLLQPLFLALVVAVVVTVVLRVDVALVFFFGRVNCCGAGACEIDASRRTTLHEQKASS